MSAKKKDFDPSRYRVSRAFKEGGRLITASHQLADLSATALQERVRRGYIEDRRPEAASDTAPAAKAKE